MSHEIWCTCPCCNAEYDAHLHWSSCPNCGYDWLADGLLLVDERPKNLSLEILEQLQHLPKNSTHDKQ